MDLMLGIFRNIMLIEDEILQNISKVMIPVVSYNKADNKPDL